MTPNDPYLARRERVREKMAGLGLDALLVAHAANRYYLSGFELHDPQCNESAGMLLVRSDGRDVLLTDSRYRDAALRLWPEEYLHIYQAPKLKDIGSFLASQNLGTLGFESEALSHATATALEEHLPMKGVAGIVEELRQIKDETEIEALRASARLNHDLMNDLPKLLKPGMTEADAAWEIEKYFRERGATGMAFEAIVGVGPNAALPHAIPGAEKLPEEGLVLVDTGARYQGYNSDQTRTLWLGDTPSERFRHVRDLVRRAQRAAMEAVKPGVEVRELYLAARKVFEEAGEAEHFTHALGHGIGLETHEPPSLGPTSQAILKPGMVFTIEPGLYYGDWGGVRWEHMILVTEDGFEVL
ncbi:M24 family metallopeptidase [Desulfohalovibrio reitneri]|uniref:M24 family metallopeptidase n=1 Tax=Desulfohalovibrio reitneri TaxID=1307759 RepID=UPI0004A6F97F|nr:aminopeptidase P family protein [Desulfohalovibrio reitneri]